MGKILALVLFILTAITVYLFVGNTPWWFPPDISEHGDKIDAQFMRTLWVVGIAFTAAQVALGYAIWRFGRRGNERAVYSHGSNKLEATWTIITAGVFIAIAILGQQVWAMTLCELKSWASNSSGTFIIPAPITHSVKLPPSS
jgi:heme/copper-type cytochrome/quinol oxidase subunit 2